MNYCNYINESKVIYSSYTDTCKKLPTEYCKEFKEYVLPYINDEEEDVFAISCNIDSSYDPGLDQGKLSRQVHRGVSGERGNVSGEVGERGNGVVETRMLKSGTAKELPPPGPNLDVQKEDYGAHGYLSSGLHEVEGDRVNSHLGTSSEGNGSHIKTITSASMVGVPSIIFLLYKFTPIRTWIDPRIRKTKNVLRKGVNESNELQSNDYNFDHADMDINRYNIAYQSR
ncbi:Plasmodium vivax Vir protein, putative [Plasmodium vivax]|uniref:Vir protein, putative n=1 Tax=Plasmodium vivax TaxID=5855 RepID=A0A1G4E6I6_PLAVI|nr:Plasmodium vivax Vir protein, putative [Plasmodium vivax]